MTDATGLFCEKDGDVTVLVVDDAAIDRRMTGAIIEQKLGWRVRYAPERSGAVQ